MLPICGGCLSSLLPRLRWKISRPDPLNAPTSDRTCLVFSVVIPTFNRASLISRAVGSVLAQTFAALELIVVDDGSTDNTLEQLRQFDDSRLRVIEQPNRGRSTARNVGAAAATGDYLLFLDSDDEAAPTWLDGLFQAGAAEQADLVCCGARWLNAAGECERITQPASLGAFYHGLSMQIRGGTFAIGREHFTRCGGYTDGLELAEHTELALRFADAAKAHGWRIENTAEPLVTIHNYGGSFRSQASELPDTIELLIQRYPERFADHPRKRTQYYNIAGVNSVRQGDLRRARRFFFSAVKSSPGDWKSVARLAVTLVPGLSNRLWPTLSEPPLATSATTSMKAIE